MINSKHCAVCLEQIPAKTAIKRHKTTGSRLCPACLKRMELHSEKDFQKEVMPCG